MSDPPRAATPLAEAGALLGRARSVVVFTGAGISAESGVPTYRSGSDGIWSVQNMQRYANPPGYAAHLPDSYAWYRARAESLATVEPNAGHRAIVALSAIVPRLVLVTQNIDSLHQRAGSEHVIELHGHLRTARCVGCNWRVAWQNAPRDPRCPSCGGMLRPEVVMFQEMLPEVEIASAMDAAAACDVLISIGTSNQVAPASEIPMIALRGGASVIIVNPDMSGQPFHRRIIYLAGLAGEILPQLTRSI